MDSAKAAAEEIDKQYMPTTEQMAAIITKHIVADTETVRVALLRYGKHERDCNYSHLSQSDARRFTPCTCGLHDVLYGKHVS